MKLRCFSVYDAKVETYMSPFFLRSKGEALRSWEAICNDNQSAICKYPHDFTLYEIGEFDDQLGSLTMHSKPVILGNALEFKKQDLKPMSDIIPSILKDKKAESANSLPS